MKRADFPKGPTPPPIIFSHFPTVQQAFIWRNWEMFPAEKLAEVLRTDAKNVLEMAAAMGLRTPPVVNGDWLKKGYNTIIRANWHLLPYEQLLQLLDWTEERLVYALKEDDFLFAKLGALKPDSAPVKYEPLTDEQKTRTRALAALIGKHFPDCAEAEAERAFAFSKYNVASEPEEPFRCGSGEVLVDGSWGIVLSPSCETANVRGYVDDFIQEIKGRWGHALTIGGQKKRAITLSLAPDRGLPPESHSVSVSGDGVAISGVDEFALLRALQWIEMKMEERSGPALPPGLFAMRTTLESRIIYPYHSHYSDPLMADPEETCPDALLKQLSRGGVNGIWLQGILYTLVPWERGPELSRGWERRIESLRNIVGRAARHGVGVYLYMGEPRCLPMSFFERNPELKGIVPSYVFGDVATLCVSTTPVKEFLRDGMAELFTKVPELAGVFTITASENPSNCHSKYSGSSCPRCSRRSPQEVIAEVNALIEEGVHRASRTRGSLPGPGGGAPIGRAARYRFRTGRPASSRDCPPKSSSWRPARRRCPFASAASPAT